MKPNLYRFNFKVVILLVLFLGVQTSCNNWIDIEPENELIKQEFWKTSDDVMSVLAASYDALRGCTEKSFLLGEVRADIVSVSGGSYSDYNRIAYNDITSTNNACRWGEYYNTINLANTVMFYAPLIQELDKSLTDRMLQGIESEMLFLRSLSYFYLVRIWKDVPLVLEATISDTVDFYIPKSPENEVIDQIVKDLKRASALAFEGQFANDRPFYKGRANKFSIQTLLADVLLWDENYEEAIVYCDSVIASGRFALEPTSKWFDLYYPGNSLNESIFEIQFDDNLEAQQNSMYNELLNLSRFASSLLSSDIDKAAYDPDIDIRICGNSGPLWKYVGTDETGATSRRRRDSQRDANFIYYRYADVLLIKAEASAETGNFDQANSLLREVAERAGTFATPIYTLPEFRNAVLVERGREFAAEGKRWFDVLRFAKKEGFKEKKILTDIILAKASDAKELAIMRTKVIDTMSYYLPIHEDEVQVNRNLVQNPFYDR